VGGARKSRTLSCGKAEYMLCLFPVAGSTLATSQARPQVFLAVVATAPRISRRMPPPRNLASSGDRHGPSLSRKSIVPAMQSSRTLEMMLPFQM
jgi:hypothetical protein